MRAIPGGFVAPAESVDEAAERELREETVIPDSMLLVSPTTRSSISQNCASTDARSAAWFSASGIPKLAFDQNASTALMKPPIVVCRRRESTLPSELGIQLRRLIPQSRVSTNLWCLGEGSDRKRNRRELGEN